MSSPRVAGRPRRAHANGVGRGITGMQERAARQGGEVLAGPTEDGFTVRARIPLRHTAEMPG